MGRKPTPQSTQTEVLIQSGRRCCICFGLKNDYNVKQGQIAHLDQDNSNNKLDNLAFLCFNHHDTYDSSTRQSKNFTEDEVKNYRDRLYKAVIDFTSQAYSDIKNNIISQNSTAISETDVRAELRNLFEKINPLIITQIDQGCTDIEAMISSSKLAVLFDLTSEPTFSDYLQIHPTGSAIIGGKGNKIGNAINDIHGGILTGYLLIPTDKLKA